MLDHFSTKHEIRRTIRKRYPFVYIGDQNVRNAPAILDINTDILLCGNDLFVRRPPTADVYDNTETFPLSLCTHEQRLKAAYEIAVARKKPQQAYDAKHTIT